MGQRSGLMICMPTSNPDLTFGTIFAGVVLAWLVIAVVVRVRCGRCQQRVDACRCALSDPAAMLAIPMLRDLPSHFFSS